MIDTSISSEPAIVNAMNLNVAPSRPGPPHTPTSTYSGMSIASNIT
jgi:hypothetical protein